MRAMLLAAVCAVCLLADSEVKAMSAETQSNQYTKWRYGPPADPSFFPIGVWAQAPRDAGKYREIGVNFLLSLPGGPTEEQLADLRKHGMRTICRQNEVGLAHADDPIIIGWMHGDEPDNFTKNDEDKWVPKATPQKIIDDYDRIRQRDPGRPVLLNLGQGVANDQWKGGWAKADDYVELVKGSDIVSYDIYPMCSSRPETAGKMELIGLGVERLCKWGEGKRIVWFITEAAHINSAERMATPGEMRSEVWMAIIHGATGIVYFCHQWQPEKDFAFPIHDPVVKGTLTKLNAQITELAPVLNSPTLEGAVEVQSANAAVPIRTMVKRHEGDVYVFAVSMRTDETTGTFQVQGVGGAAEAEVLGEGRKVAVSGGRFSDTFNHYAAHIYRIRGGR
jgi:hypothetical protein